MSVYSMITVSRVAIALLISNIILFKMFVDRGHEVDKLKSTIHEVTSEYENAKAEYLKVIDTNNKLNIQLSKTNRKLELAKSRQEVVYKKPKLVEKMINKSFAEFEKEMSCVTGSLSSCQ